MNKLAYFLVSSAFFSSCHSFAQTTPSAGQSFIIQETNIKKNTAQCVGAAKKCARVLLKQQTAYTLAFSSKSRLTNNAINGLSDKFINFFPKESKKDEGPVIERGFESQRDQIVKLTYAYLPPDKYETTDYAQVIVFFDNSGSSPTVDDIQVKNKIDLGIVRITEREKLKFKPEPITQAKPETKPATKTATKTATKSTTKPATKSATKPATKSTTKPAAKSTAKPATKSTTTPATSPATKKKT